MKNVFVAPLLGAPELRFIEPPEPPVSTPLAWMKSGERNVDSRFRV